MSLTLGKVIGIEIKLHYTWFVIFLLVTWSLATLSLPVQYPGLSVIIYWALGALSAIILFASVLLHELAHSYIALRNGIQVPSITLFVFGGVSQIAEEPQSPSVEFKLSLVGPLSSFVLAVVFGVAWFFAITFRLGALVAAPLFYGSFVNLILGVFNLIPAFPLDGGRILRAFLWGRKNDLVEATKISTHVGVGFAYALIFAGFFLIFIGAWMGGLWLMFIGLFLKSGAEASLRQTVVSQALADVNVKDIMSSQVITIDPDMTVAEAVSEYFSKHKHQGFPTVKDGKIKGIVTLHDLQKLPREKWNVTPVNAIMTPAERLVYVKPGEPAIEAMIKMSRAMVGRLPVLEEEKVVGIVTRSDLMQAVKFRTAVAEKPMPNFISKPLT
ncbi:MAG: site-2 protease family protein [Candidatus Bathyarchaeia archaeon]